MSGRLKTRLERAEGLAGARGPGRTVYVVVDDHGHALDAVTGDMFTAEELEARYPGARVELVKIGGIDLAEDI